MNAKGQNKKPRYAGLDERDVTTNEVNVPSTWFVGVRKLNGAAIMSPIITQVKNSPGQAKK